MVKREHSTHVRLSEEADAMLELMAEGLTAAGWHDLDNATARVKVGDLDIFYREAGSPTRPAVVLLHGFPELPYSWRHQLSTLAAEAFSVAAENLWHGLPRFQWRSTLKTWALLVPQVGVARDQKGLPVALVVNVLT